MDSRKEDVIPIKIVWQGMDATPVMLANQFVIQDEQDELFLTIGQLQPPFLMGNDEERRQMAEELPFVAARVLGRFAFTRQRLAELHQAIGEHLEKYDMRHKEDS